MILFLFRDALGSTSSTGIVILKMKRVIYDGPGSYKQQLWGCFRQYEEVAQKKACSNRVEILILSSTDQHAQFFDMPVHQSSLRIESYTEQPSPTVTFYFRTIPEMCNFTENLHGGCAATLIDGLTTVLLGAVSRPGFFSHGGVSRNLRVTYFRAIRAGTVVKMVCELVHVGGRLALLRAQMYNDETGELCIAGENEKANSDMRSESKM